MHVVLSRLSLCRLRTDDPEVTALLLFQTYPLYHDRRSRYRVYGLLQHKTLHTADFLQRYVAECKRPTLARSNALVLVHWGAILVLDSEIRHEILVAWALVLELCLREPPTPRKGVSKSAVRAVKHVLPSLDNSPDTVGHLLAAGTYKVLPLVGLIASVSDVDRNAIYVFYLKEVVGSRSAIPIHVARSLCPLFQTCTAADFQSQLAPALEKALLRAPEVVLDGVFVSLLECLNSGQDFGPAFVQHFEASLRGHVRSTNEMIRNGASAAFVILLQKSSSVCEQVASRLVKSLSETKNPQERFALASLLNRAPAEKAGSETVCQSLLQVVVKEGNDGCLEIESETLIRYMLLRSPNLRQNITKTLLSALNSNKNHIWLHALGQVLWPSINNPSDSTRQLLEDIGAVLHKLCDEVAVASQTSMPPSNIIAAAYIAIAISPAGHHIGLVVNSKLYQKLPSSDYKWHYRALMANFEPSSPAWAEAVIAASDVATIPSLREENSKLLRELYQIAPLEVASVLLPVVRHRVSVATSGCTQIVQAIRPTRNLPKEKVRRQLIDSIVVLQLVPGISWIDTCLCAKQDPGELVKSEPMACWEQIENNLDIEATYAAAAELAFVSSEAMLPFIKARISQRTSIQDLDSEEIAIWATPKGTLFREIAEPQKLLDKKQSEYEIEVWEAEMRQKLAKKNQQVKKLSSEEQAKINKQLDSEQAIRSKVELIRLDLVHATKLILGLAMGPPTDIMMWLSDAISALTAIAHHGGAALLGNHLLKTYLACAKFGVARFGHDHVLLAVAILRTAQADAAIEPDLLVEPLPDLSIRLLRRFHFLSSQVPLDPIHLTLTLPFITQIIQHALETELADNDDVQERLTLALEFLSFHVDQFYHANIFRLQTLELLLQCARRLPEHFRLIKDCLHGICGSSMTPDETNVLTDGALVPEPSVRALALQTLREHADPTDSIRVWLTRFDEENAELGNLIWLENGLELTQDAAALIISYLHSPEIHLRAAAARGLAAFLDDTTFLPALQLMQSQLKDLVRPPKSEKDAYGMPRPPTMTDAWEARSGFALAFHKMAKSFPVEQIVPFIEFLVQTGLLGDRNPKVRRQYITAASSIISLHGASQLEELMRMCEDALDHASSDLMSEAIIVLYGALASHLAYDDARLPALVRRLLAALETPSESVQYAVANCLPPLIHGEETAGHLSHVLHELHHSPKYSARRGAAYGLAGIVKGYGLAALSRFRILSVLRAGLDNKKDANQREGSLFAYEQLSALLGPLFEPWVIRAVPQLLCSFGDANADVREACLDASRACFSQLTSYGVKVVLPTLLDGLDETQWRSKKGACELLGAMAYLNPQQLAQSLPDIIPPLTNVLNDSHKEVRAAASRSLARFGEVIVNPEVKSLVPVLLKALSDATKYTDNALDALIKVSFVHYIDAPSLALVVRILQRGLEDRSALKRKSAQIIGSLAHLTDKKDILSHLPILVNGLKLAAVDPVPTTRATASKALGSLVERLGEDALPDLISSLMNTLKADTGAGDRLGSAQALSEVLAGLGTSRLEESLPSILSNVSSPRPSVREGFMSLFIYLPVCFGTSFANYLARIVPPVLAGLADDVESIRETSLRAGRLLVKNFASKAIDLLLPELDRGLADDNHRIRLSSVELVGDLLFNLTGISGEEDGPEAVHSLLEVLGETRRNQILSSLYICRCDTSGLVRSAAINVWKALVSSPRTLKELVPTLTQLIIGRLASPNAEKKLMAGNALGELIRKAGEGVLALLLPVLQRKLDSRAEIAERQGICVALREIAESAAVETLADYEEITIDITRNALVDADSSVREAAAEAFDALQQVFGKRAVDQVLPHLLQLLGLDESADVALSALLTLLTDKTRSNLILPNLVPNLIASPMTAFSANAVAALTRVAGSAMNRRLPNILNALMDNIVADQERAAMEDAFDVILLSLDEYDGLNTGMSVMLALVKHADHHRRAAANVRLSNFFAAAKSDYARYHPDLIRVLLIGFDDSDVDVVKSAWLALSELTKKLRKEEMETLTASTRQSLLQVGVAGAVLPGFRLAKGIGAVLPIFLQGLMNGPAEQRTLAASSISDLIARCDVDGLKPYITQITGPLIRVVSERSVDLKIAVLTTLNKLLDKTPTLLKPFLPQLQRTFAKCLGDASSETLRNRAARALGSLITLAPRIDPLIIELVAGTKVEDAGVRAAMLKALFEVTSKAGSLMNESSRALVLGLVDDDENLATVHAKLFGAVVRASPPDPQLIKPRLATVHTNRTSSLILNALLLACPDRLDDVPKLVALGMQADDVQVSADCIVAAGKYLLRDCPAESASTILEPLAAKLEVSSAIDARRLALVVIRTVARLEHGLVQPHMALLVPRVFANVRDPVIPIKLAAEAAFLTIFQAAEQNSRLFDEYMSLTDLAPGPKRSMQDYFKRVTLRLAAQIREQRSSGAGLELTSDEQEDEREIWSVGKVDLNDDNPEL